MVSARFYEKTGMLVLTSHAFGAGHLFCRHGEGPVWHGTWAVKGGAKEVERKWQAMGEGETPIPCLLFIDRFGWLASSPLKDPVYDWIDEEIETHHRIHIPSEVVRVRWLDPTADEDRYPWRLRVTATGSFRFSP